MPRALSICTTSGCHEATKGGRCTTCKATAEATRGSAASRGYDHRHRTVFVPGVLRRDPLCVCTITSHGHGAPCAAPSQHADHHPLSRRELVALGLNPNDPSHGRGLCHSCHSSHTAHAQPGGWHHAP